MATRIHATFGRFGIFHNGHQSIVEQMRRNLQGNDEIMLGFSTGRSNRELANRIDNFYDHDSANCTIEVQGFSNLYVFIEHLAQAYDEAIIYVGTDRGANVNNIASRFNNVSTFILNREQNGFSSSLIRSFIAEAEDYESFCSMAIDSGILSNSHQCRNAWQAYSQEQG